MIVRELISILKQFNQELPVIVFNTEGDEILKIPETLPTIVVGNQTVNNKDVTLILCSRKETISVKIQTDNSSRGNGAIENRSNKSPERNDNNKRRNNFTKQRRKG